MPDSGGGEGGEGGEGAFGFCLAFLARLIDSFIALSSTVYGVSRLMT